MPHLRTPLSLLAQVAVAWEQLPTTQQLATAELRGQPASNTACQKMQPARCKTCKATMRMSNFESPAVLLVTATTATAAVTRPPGSRMMVGVHECPELGCSMVAGLGLALTFAAASRALSMTRRQLEVCRFAVALWPACLCPTSSLSNPFAAQRTPSQTCQAWTLMHSETSARGSLVLTAARSSGALSVVRSPAVLSGRIECWLRCRTCCLPRPRTSRCPRAPLKTT